MIEYNDGQLEGIIKGRKWFNKLHKQTFEIDGAAGTGKTTMIMGLIEQLGLDLSEVLFMAYVGKASLAMTLKGMQASTIHSALYEMRTMPATDEYGEKIKVNDRVLMKPVFLKKESLPPNIKLLVVDEGGMVPAKNAKDILSFGLPTIVLGDLAQLDPVMGKRFFLSHPDHSLNEIMRQNENNPIIRLATDIRVGNDICHKIYGERCMIIPEEDVDMQNIVDADLILTRTNRFRQAINDYFRREVNKYTGLVPKEGEKIICRRNNWSKQCGDLYLINGMIGTVDYTHRQLCDKEVYCIDFRPDVNPNDYFDRLKINKGYFNSEIGSIEHDTVNKFNKYELFEYAYAITCHLAQGSEANNVVVFPQMDSIESKSSRQWLYTAVTRAVESCIVIM